MWTSEYQVQGKRRMTLMKDSTFVELESWAAKIAAQLRTPTSESDADNIALEYIVTKTNFQIDGAEFRALVSALMNKPVTIHATTRQQIKFRVKSERFIYE